VPHQLQGAIGDHLVGVHVGRGARASLEDVEPELVVELSSLSSRQAPLIPARISLPNTPQLDVARAAASFTMANRPDHSGYRRSSTPEIWKFSRARAVGRRSRRPPGGFSPEDRARSARVCWNWSPFPSQAWINPEILGLSRTRRSSAETFDVRPRIPPAASAPRAPPGGRWLRICQRSSAVSNPEPPTVVSRTRGASGRASARDRPGGAGAHPVGGHAALRAASRIASAPARPAFRRPGDEDERMSVMARAVSGRARGRRADSGTPRPLIFTHLRQHLLALGSRSCADRSSSRPAFSLAKKARQRRLVLLGDRLLASWVPSSARQAVRPGLEV